MSLGNACPNNPGAITIIGVVGDAKALPRKDASPVVYLPFGNTADPLTVVLRTKGDPSRMSNAIRRSMTEFDSNVPLFGEVTPLALRDRQMSQERLLRTLLTFFGSFALLLCSLGIYGLLSYTVSRRTSEIGLHMALGAQKPAVIRMIVRESLIPVALGLLLGIVVAFGLDADGGVDVIRPVPAGSADHRSRNHPVHVDCRSRGRFACPPSIIN